jgi:hypothetical protein
MSSEFEATSFATHGATKAEGLRTKPLRPGVWAESAAVEVGRIGESQRLVTEVMPRGAMSW